MGKSPRQGRPRMAEVGSDPDYRFSLANERTFLAWIRTALALLAAGVAVVQFAEDIGRPVRLAVGITLIIIAGMMSSAAHHRWSTRERAIRLGATLPGTRLGLLLGYGLTAVTVAVAVVLAVSA